MSVPRTDLRLRYAYDAIWEPRQTRVKSICVATTFAQIMPWESMIAMAVSSQDDLIASTRSPAALRAGLALIER